MVIASSVTVSFKYQVPTPVVSSEPQEVEVYFQTFKSKPDYSDCSEYIMIQTVMMILCEYL